MKEIVLFVPGIFGSRLRDKHGDDVWPPTPREALFGYKRTDKLLGDLQPNGVVETVCVDVYGKILRALEGLGYTASGADRRLVAYAYDWRRDLLSLAGELDAAVTALHENHGPDISIKFICHSMGGLLTRACLERPGARRTALGWAGEARRFPRYAASGRTAGLRPGDRCRRQQHGGQRGRSPATDRGLELSRGLSTILFGESRANLESRRRDTARAVIPFRSKPRRAVQADAGKPRRHTSTAKRTRLNPSTQKLSLFRNRERCARDGDALRHGFGRTRTGESESQRAMAPCRSLAPPPCQSRLRSSRQAIWGCRRRRQPTACSVCCSGEPNPDRSSPLARLWPLCCRSARKLWRAEHRSRLSSSHRRRDLLTCQIRIEREAENFAMVMVDVLQIHAAAADLTRLTLASPPLSVGRHVFTLVVDDKPVDEEELLVTGTSND